MNIFDRTPMTGAELDRAVLLMAKVAAYGMILAVAVGWACRIAAWWR